MKGVIRRLYDVSLPLLTPMHYVHLVHACVFGKWIDTRADSGIRRISMIATYMAGAAIWRGRVALAWFSAQLQLESSRPVAATVLASITALILLLRIRWRSCARSLESVESKRDLLLIQL